MKKRRLWICVGLLALVSTMVLAVLLEPTQIIRGYIAGDAFYRDRPTRYWREQLRADGRTGHLRQKIVGLFRETQEAFPVLRVCASDPDRNVRWPAIALLGHGNARSEAILSVLVVALDDEDMEVRLQAIGGLDQWRRMARSAVPALAKHLKDPELQVAYLADIALWNIDPSAAAKEGGWKPFRSKDWKFTVMLPDEPKDEVRPLPFGNPGVVHGFLTWHKIGSSTAPTCYAVAVTEYPRFHGGLGHVAHDEQFDRVRVVDDRVSYRGAPFAGGLCSLQQARGRRGVVAGPGDGRRWRNGFQDRGLDGRCAEAQSRLRDQCRLHHGDR